MNAATGAKFERNCHPKQPQHPVFGRWIGEPGKPSGSRRGVARGSARLSEGLGVRGCSPRIQSGPRQCGQEPDRQSFWGVSSQAPVGEEVGAGGSGGQLVLVNWVAESGCERV